MTAEEKKEQDDLKAKVKALEKSEKELSAKLEKSEAANAKLSESEKVLKTEVKTLKQTPAPVAAADSEEKSESQKLYEDSLVENRKQSQALKQKADSLDTLFKQFQSDFAKILKG